MKVVIVKKTNKQLYWNNLFLKLLTNMKYIAIGPWSPNGCPSAPQMHSSIFSGPHVMQPDIKTADAVSNDDF